MPTLRFDDFSGGLWIPAERGSPNEQPGFAVPANALLQAENVEYLPTGGLRGRRGLSNRGQPGETGEEVIALWRHYGRAGQVDATNRSRSWLDYTGVGAFAWEHTPDAWQEDSTAAFVNLSRTGPGTIQSHYLGGYGWGFGVPDDAKILGIQVDILRRAAVGGDGAVRDAVVSLTKSGGFPTATPIGDNKAAVLQNWPIGSFEWASYGGPSELWGTTWTPAEVNMGAPFGVLISVESTVDAEVAEVDCVRMTIWYSTTEDRRRFLAVVNRSGLSTWRIFNEDSVGNWTWLSNLTPTAYRPRFLYWPARNKTFIFSGGKTVLVYDGTDLANLVGGVSDDVLLTPRTGPYATLFNERLWATEPNELGYSVYASDILDEETWRPENHLNVSDAQGGKIVGLVPYRDALYIIKDTSIWQFVGDIDAPTQLGQVSERGCVAPDTVQLTPFGIIYLAADGLYLFTPEGEIELSSAIRPLFAGRTTETTYRTAVGIYHPRRRAYYLKLDPTAAECWVLHGFTRGEQTVWAWSRIPTFPMYSACVWPGEQDTGELFIGSVDGFVREADTGTTDEGVAIPLAIQTVFQPLDNQRRRGRVYEVSGVFRSTVALSGALRYDQAEADAVAVALGAALSAPAFQYPRMTVTDQAHLGRFVSLRLANAVDGPEAEFYEVSLEVAMRSARR